MEYLKHSVLGGLIVWPCLDKLVEMHQKPIIPSYICSRYTYTRLLITMTDNDGSEIRDDEVYTDGDFSIISSDHVRFRLPSFYMLAARYAKPASAPHGWFSISH